MGKGIRNLLAGLLIVGLAASACSSDELEPEPTQPAGGAAVPTASATAAPAPTETPAPTPTVAAVPSPPSQQGLLFEYTYAIRLLESRLYEEAIPVFNVVVKRKPDLASAWRGRAVAYYHEDQFEFALEDFNEAIKINPEYADAYKGRAVLYKDLGETDKAVADLQKAISFYHVVREQGLLREARQLLNELTP